MLMPCILHLLFVVMPVGHSFVWHLSDCMHPSASMAPLAVSITSAPMANASAAWAGVKSLPELLIVTLSLIPASFSFLSR